MNRGVVSSKCLGLTSKFIGASEEDLKYNNKKKTTTTTHRQWNETNYIRKIVNCRRIDEKKIPNPPSAPQKKKDNWFGKITIWIRITPVPQALLRSAE